MRNLSNQLKLDEIKNFYSILNDVEVDKSKYSYYYSGRYVYERSKSYGMGCMLILRIDEEEKVRIPIITFSIIRMI